MKKIFCLLLVILVGVLPALAEETTPTEGSIDKPFAIGVSYVFSTEINSDGTARTVANDDPYDTIELAVVLDQALTPDDYASKHSRTYMLKGTEACCSIRVTLNSAGSASSVVLQDAVLVGLCDETGSIDYGYQMMDAEIGGSPEVAVSVGETKQIYKRYDYRAESKLMYLFITYYVGGESQTVYFSLRVTYPTLEKDSENTDAVRKLQSALVTRGYLTGSADGIFGAMTEEAVKAAQKAAGMAETGVADDALQRWLYGE